MLNNSGVSLVSARRSLAPEDLSLLSQCPELWQGYLTFQHSFCTPRMRQRGNHTRKNWPRTEIDWFPAATIPKIPEQLPAGSFSGTWPGQDNSGEGKVGCFHVWTLQPQKQRNEGMTEKKCKGLRSLNMQIISSFSWVLQLTWVASGCTGILLKFLSFVL